MHYPDVIFPLVSKLSKTKALTSIKLNNTACHNHLTRKYSVVKKFI